MKWLVPIILVIIIICSIKSEAEKRGFCFRKFSHIDNLYTEQELIDRAILLTIKRSPSSVIYHNNGLSEKNLEIFKQINPNCCRLSKLEPDYYNPAYIGLIIVEHKTFDEKKYERGGYKRYIAYDSCGNVNDRFIN